MRRSLIYVLHLGQTRTTASTQAGATTRPSIAAIVLLALAVHGPLLLMQMPARSYDANTHIFFAAHYARHWFDPWNPKWFAGFSQTTYPPLVHQLIAAFSFIVGLTAAYMLVQLFALLLLPVGIFRCCRLWLHDDRSAAYAAIASVFLGSIAMLIYQAGQLPNIFASVLVLNALPFVYVWMLDANRRAFFKGSFLLIAAAAAHHITALFGLALFVTPVAVLAVIDAGDRPRSIDNRDSVGMMVVLRGLMLGGAVIVITLLVLAPYFIIMHANRIPGAPIPHASRDNYLLNAFSGINFWIVPYGALALTIPYIFWKGTSVRRLTPLFLAWWLTTMLGLGGTSIVAPALLGHAFHILTFERFTYWATLMALPFVGLLASELIARWRMTAVVALTATAVCAFGGALYWGTVLHPPSTEHFDVQPVIRFMERDEHDRWRYLLLGFGPEFSYISTRAPGATVDGDYNAARLLPEFTRYATGKLNDSKFYGENGMNALRAMLEHANQYGLKFVFVHDHYYDPLLASLGWKQVEVYDGGDLVVWAKEGVPPAQTMVHGLLPTHLQGILWGTLPIGSGIVALLCIVFLRQDGDDLDRLMQVQTAACADVPALQEAT